MHTELKNNTLTFTGFGAYSTKATFEAGQAFRFAPMPGGSWQGVVAGRLITVNGENDDLSITPACEEDIPFYTKYFALDIDYINLHALFNRYPALAGAVAFAPGIRVLQQEFFETLITFVLSQNNNIPRITGLVNRLCALCGEAKGGFYAFPTPAALAACTAEALTAIGAGYRAPYLLAAAAAVNSGQLNEAALRAMPYLEAKAALCAVHGIGPKVADCVLLFSLGKYEAVPMDVWMKKAMPAIFVNGELPKELLPFAGIAQQYIFNWARANL